MQSALPGGFSVGAMNNDLHFFLLRSLQSLSRFFIELRTVVRGYDLLGFNSNFVIAFCKFILFNASSKFIFIIPVALVLLPPIFHNFT